MHRRIPALALALSALGGASAAAGPATFYGSGSSGSQTLSATASFAALGTQLQVVLSNLGSDVLNGNGILTAVFFDISGNPALTRDAATLTPGSTVLFGGTDPGDVVGGEWSYRFGLAGAPGDASHGISTGGHGLFNASNRFPGSNLQGNNSVAGLGYGIISAVDSTATGVDAVTGNNALIRSSVSFLLGDLPLGFDPEASISNVTFQFSNQLSGPSLVGTVPEPAGLALLPMALAALGWVRRRAG